VDKIKQLEKLLEKYQKQYDDLRLQSPERWWHDEHFDNQLRVLDAMITEIKEELVELKKSNRSDVILGSVATPESDR